MMTQFFKTLFVTALLGLSLSACVYKADVQQGNIITDKDIAQIHSGMDAGAVQQILGEPLLRNVYQTGEMYYVYTMKQGHHPMYRRNITIYFQDGRVTRYTTDSAIDDHNNS